MPNRLLYSENIVKGESRGKQKNEVFKFDYAEPTPIPREYDESQAENKISDPDFRYFFIPNRILYYRNIGKATKPRSRTFLFFIRYSAKSYYTHS